MARDKIELLKYMLTDIREVTLRGVKGLTKEQLFAAPLANEYSAGAYLMHLAEVELYWYEVLSGDKLDEELRKRCYYDNWYDGRSNPLSPPKEPIEVQEYSDVLGEIRAKLFAYLDSIEDDELAVEVESGPGRKLSKQWIVYHIIEHEAHTRGQMFLLLRMYGLRKPGENN